MWWGFRRRTLLLVALVGVLVGLVFLFWFDWDFASLRDSAVNTWKKFSATVQYLYDSVDRLARFIAPMVTILGGGYAIFHRWNYNKNRMHYHLDAFIKRENESLKQTRSELDKVVQRPSPARQFGEPLFQRRRLQPALKRMNWDRFHLGNLTQLSAMNRADDNLEHELQELEHQLESWTKIAQHYEERQAQTHLLRGAIAASRAANPKAAKKDSYANALRALEHFEEARRLNKGDPEALEYVGHMRVRLAQLSVVRCFATV